MKKLLLIAILLMPITTAKAGDVGTDKYAHFGLSYVITTGFFGFYKAILTRDCRNDYVKHESCPLTSSERVGAASFAAVTSLIIGFVKEMGDRRPDGGDILANGLGSAAAMGSIVLFEF